MGLGAGGCRAFEEISFGRPVFPRIELSGEISEAEGIDRVDD